MIFPNELNIAAYQLIKMIKLYGLDWKSQFNTNNYAFLNLLMLNSAKKCKMAQN